MKQIQPYGQLGINKFTLVDDDDFEKVSKYKWYYGRSNRKFYLRAVKQINKKRYYFYLHRLILNAAKGQQVDHINGNTLDNRKCNLRICLSYQNQYNQLKQKRKLTSKFKGVYRQKLSNKWVAQIKIHQKAYYLGRFKTEIEAAKAYDQKAKELFGEFANLNVKEQKSRHYPNP